MSLAEMSVVSGGNVNYVTGELIIKSPVIEESLCFSVCFYIFLEAALVLRYCNYWFENGSQKEGKRIQISPPYLDLRSRLYVDSMLFNSWSNYNGTTFGLTYKSASERG